MSDEEQPSWLDEQLKNPEFVKSYVEEWKADAVRAEQERDEARAVARRLAQVVVVAQKQTGMECDRRTAEMLATALAYPVTP